MQIRHLIAPILLLMASTPCTSAPDEPWFSPPGGAWVPALAVTSNMKDALDAALRPVLAAKAEATLPPTRYWFQYIATGFGADRRIDILGRPFPVLRHADRTFFGALMPEACHVHARYMPSERKMEGLAVGGFNCPPRI
jgi:hypothetical protein